MVEVKSNVLSLLEVYAEDSDLDSDSEASTAWSDGGAPTGRRGGLVPAGYGEDDFTHLDGAEEGYKEKDDGNSRQPEDDDSRTKKPVAGDLREFRKVKEGDPQKPVASFSARVWNMSPDEVKIPPEPPGRCSSQLQDKIKKLYERKIKEGLDMNYIIQKKREFRNPTIYEKLIQFCSIDEIGTNYPKDVFDPHGWSEDSYYEALAEAQNIEMDKLARAKNKRTKIETALKRVQQQAPLPPPPQHPAPLWEMPRRGGGASGMTHKITSSHCELPRPEGRNPTFLPGCSLRLGTPGEHYHWIPRGQDLHNQH